MKAIVLAGGGGTRLWPLSRESFPKQFLRFGSDLSLLQKTVQRLEKIDFIDCILVSTNKGTFDLVKEQLSKVPSNKTHILTEPCRKNTAPAIALSLQYLKEYCKASDFDPILVLPSDHLIEPESMFVQTLAQMGQIVAENKIITFGIRPTKPEIGYGYIRIGKPYNAFAFESAQFVEKPNLHLAKKYLKDPHYYWNSGMFLFSSFTFWEELSIHSLELYSCVGSSYIESAEHFDQMPDISIDFALMEKSKKILICPMAVSWSDIGSWDSLYEVLEKDENQNVKIGEVLDIDTKNSLIIGNKRLISTIGIEDMLVIETEDAIFVGKKGESQRVKSIVKELLAKGRNEGICHTTQSHAWGYLQTFDRGENHFIQKIHLLPNQHKPHSVKQDSKEHWTPLQDGLEVEKIPLAPHKAHPVQPGDYVIMNKTSTPVDLIILHFDKKSATI